MAVPIKLRQVDRTDPTPKYLQAQRILAEAISAGALPAGCKLPSTKDIGQLVNVSLITAHKALEALAEAGLLRREAGRGTFVRDDVHESMAQARQVVIGLALDARANLNDYYHSSILNGLRQAARSDKEQIEFYFQDHLRPPRRRAGGGVICIHPPVEAKKQVARLAERVPTILLGGSFADVQVGCVDCDNRKGAGDAVRYLHELGHRRFLLLSGPTSLSNSRDRVDGAVEALGALGIPSNDYATLVSTDSVIIDEESQSILHHRLRADQRPTAIVAGGYFLALAAMHAVRQVGLTIPDDVSVVGFDDPEAAPLLNPPLTTVRQPLLEMADTAFRMLREQIAGGAAEFATITLPTQLIVRETAGPAADV
ncbi:MAG TPA: GntR family transcriptional regulator [Phycisphaerae bacterium]|nr:GntR family transcriptional regulator [Phycisphaerae bacterium]